MTNSSKLGENIEGVENFRAWKYRIMLILEEHDLDEYVKEEVEEPKEEEEKSKQKQDMIKVKRIIANSIKDHLISQVSSKNTLKEVFDALTNIFEGKKHQQENDLVKPTQGCDDAKGRNHAVILLKSISYERIVRICW